MVYRAPSGLGTSVPPATGLRRKKRGYQDFSPLGNKFNR
ncbi:MAG: hypothetical protein ACD_21C00287G0002, partial [uncultured bacterium]